MFHHVLYIMVIVPLKGMVGINEVLSLVNYRAQGRGEQFNYHSHQEYEIYLFHAGSCRYVIHNQIYDLNPGDILVMNGLVRHKPHVIQNSNYVRSFIHFPPHWIEGVLEEMGSIHLLDVFKKHQHFLIRTNENDESTRLENTISLLAELNQTSEPHSIYIETEIKVLLLQALVIVHKLWREKVVTIEGKGLDNAKHAENIASYIQLNYSDKLSLDKISKALNLSKPYLSHVFKKTTGLTIMEYLMRCRLTQVKYSLEMEPEKTLKDIALECGFENVSHFSRLFHEKIGMTARDYRLIRQKICSREK